MSIIGVNYSLERIPLDASTREWRPGQSWVAWREGKLAEAEKLGQAALAQWQSVRPANFYSAWAALLQLTSIALIQDRLAEAVNFARGILAPEQEWLPEKLAASLEEAIAAWDAAQPQKACSFLQEGIATAREQGWL